MRVVAVGIVTGCIPARQIRLIGMSRMRIPLRRVMVAAQTHIDMGRHMHQVPGARHQAGQAIRAGHRPLRSRCGFDRMDVVMTGAGVIGTLAAALPWVIPPVIADVLVFVLAIVFIKFRPQGLVSGRGV